MKSLEFRNVRAYPTEPLNNDQARSVLPLDLTIHREVYWLHGEQVTKKRLLGLGSRVVTELVTEKETYRPEPIYIDAGEIAQLHDPNLRYALRFADAAESLGWMPTGEFSMSGHSVTVVATEAGVDSKLLSATYSGKAEEGNDTFMHDLTSCIPEVS